LRQGQVRRTNFGWLGRVGRDPLGLGLEHLRVGGAPAFDSGDLAVQEHDDEELALAARRQVLPDHLPTEIDGLGERAEECPGCAVCAGDTGDGEVHAPVVVLSHDDAVRLLHHVLGRAQVSVLRVEPPARDRLQDGVTEARRRECVHQGLCFGIQRYRCLELHGSPLWLTLWLFIISPPSFCQAAFVDVQYKHMNPSATFQKYPATAIKIWIWLGVLVFVLMLIVPVSLGRKVVSEYQRFLACKNGSRMDCQSSAVWAMNDWQLAITSGLPGVATSTDQGVFDQRSTRSSTTAPTITSVKLENATFENGSYRVAANAPITVTAVISGAKTVTAYVIPQGSAGRSLSVRVATLKVQGVIGSNESAYSGTFKLAPGTFSKGELEVRVKNSKGETASVFLKLGVK